MQIKPYHDPFFFQGNDYGVLLVHAFSSSPLDMTAFGRFFKADGYTVYAPLLKGHGAGYADLVSSKMEEWVESVRQAYDYLQPKCSRIFVVGLSLGGMLALHAGEFLPVDGVISLAAPVEYADQHIKFDGTVYSTYIGDIPARSMFELRKLQNVVVENLHRISAPVLAIQCEGDKIAHKESLKIIYSNVSSRYKSTILLPSDEHVITKGKIGREVYNLITRFLQELQLNSKINQ